MGLGSERADGGLKPWFGNCRGNTMPLPFGRALELGGKKLKKVPSCCVPPGTASLWSHPPLQRPVCLRCGAPVRQHGEAGSLPTPKVKIPP